MVLKSNEYEKPLTYYRMWHKHFEKHLNEYIEQNKSNHADLTKTKAENYINDKLTQLREIGIQIEKHLITVDKNKHPYYQILYKNKMKTFITCLLN